MDKAAHRLAVFQNQFANQVRLVGSAGSRASLLASMTRCPSIRLQYFRMRSQTIHPHSHLATCRVQNRDLEGFWCAFPMCRHFTI